MATNRMFRNYISDSSLQFRFAAMAITIFLFMVSAVVGYSYLYLDKIMVAIFEIPEIPEGAVSIYESMIGGYFTGLTMLLLSLSSFAVAFIVVQTHKIAGAKFAIVRHIREDMQKFRFDRSIKLRETDYLHDLAFEINRLGEIIMSKGVLLPDPLNGVDQEGSLSDSADDEDAPKTEKIGKAI
jgi:hypothetical protein